MTLPVKNISVSISSSARKVFEFARNYENLPRWASGLSSGIKNVNGDWTATSLIGNVIVKFVPENEFGILDHNVILPNGAAFYNPLRVFPNSDGCEILFTLFKQENISLEEFEKDGETILKDLLKLKELVEN